MGRAMSANDQIAFTFPPAAIDAIAARVVELLAEQSGPTRSTPWLDVDEAAAYLRCSKQAIYDRVNQGALEPARDGRRLLFRVERLDEYLESGRAA